MFFKGEFRNAFTYYFMYLDTFYFATIKQEEEFINYIERTCYDSYYPFGVLSAHCLRQIDFEPITIFYGGNGCGKTTALNIIAEKIRIERGTVYNRSNFFEDYLSFCECDGIKKIPKDSRIITSDDVFDFMLNLRNLNEGIDNRREELFKEYIDYQHTKFQMKSLDDYEELNQRCLQSI